MRHGALAQLVEQLTLNQPVPGSSPGRLTILSRPDGDAPKLTSRMDVAYRHAPRLPGSPQEQAVSSDVGSWDAADRTRSTMAHVSL
jgi:hypothetical protein